MNMESGKEKFDAIIVGAGPVGLWLACELALQEVKVLVLDRKTEFSPNSRALTIHGRTLEVFAMRGIVERFQKKGLPIPTGHFAALNTRVDFSRFNSRFPFTWFIPQVETEKVLYQRAIELGAEVRFGVQVNEIQEQDQYIEIIAQASDKTKLRAIATFVVGADGARSIVRTSAGIEFDGIDADQTTMLGDVILNVPEKNSVISETNQFGQIMIAPLGDNIHHRVVCYNVRRSKIPRQESVSLGELSQAAKEILGYDLNLRDPIWLSRFTNETKIARSYQRGRIFLAGDAAHIHLPAGGQGMNVGIQDAMNLGWKMASAIKKGGNPNDEILRTYESERHPVGVNLFQNTLAQGVLMAGLTPSVLALRELFDDLLKIEAVNDHIANQLTGFGIHYSPLGIPLKDFHPTQGVRVPDFDIYDKHGLKTTVYGMLKKGDWIQIDARNIQNRPQSGVFSEHKIFLIRPDGYLAAENSSVPLISGSEGG